MLGFLDEDFDPPESQSTIDSTIGSTSSVDFGLDFDSDNESQDPEYVFSLNFLPFRSHALTYCVAVSSN